MVMPIMTVEFSLLSDSRKDKPIWLCDVTTIQDDMLYCDMPVLEPKEKYNVKVVYGSTVSSDVGTVSLTDISTGLSTITIIAIGCGSGLVLLVVIVIIVVLKCRLSQTDRGIKKLQDKMDNLEMTVAKECKEGMCVCVG